MNKMNTELLTEIIKPKTDKILDFNQLEELFKKILESESEKTKCFYIAKNRLEELISKTPTSDLRNELTEINILFNK